ncbi:MAG TPA: NADH-quinone oxidoreductase subunit NuoG [Roseiflexaceae bacterium]|nr:NADH-quinone oxidoreductase subunit NuoG [Roseiflexaceae bacterium]
MPDVNLIVDGHPVTVPAGTNLVEAARLAGVPIPVFCYHPKLKPVGMCRMCLVEVWTPRIDPATRQPVIGPDGQPQLALMMNKLQPGCVTPVSEGMVVKTTTEKVRFAQRGQLEFLLTSHPLDCPVCDKGGECPLQNLTMQFGPSTSRFDYADKVHFVKPIPLGDLIYLDRERCILCSRCVRFQDDVADDPVLGFDNRGRAWEIISKSDPPFDSKFSGNTTDICPVGALTSSDFRFKARVWEVRSTPSICPHCPVGCDIALDMRHNSLMRVMPRENDYVNEIWICDKGRYGMRFLESDERLTTPLIRRGERLEPATWDEAYALIAEKLSQIQAVAGGRALAGLAGPELANEDLYLFQKLFRQTLGSNNLDHRAGAPDDLPLDTLGASLGVGAGTNLLALGKGAAVLVFGADPEEEAMLYVPRLRGIVARGGDLTVVNAYPTKLERSATRSLRVRAGAEELLALALLKVVAEERLVSADIAARLRNVSELMQQLAALSLAELAAAAGVTEEAVQATARAFASAEHGIIMYGRAALAADPSLLEMLGNLALLTGKVGRPGSGLIPLLPGGNARGALDMGVRPDAGPGGAALRQAGLSAREMWAAAEQGQLRGMIVAGLNPAAHSPQAVRGLEALEFLAVADLFLTETAQLADVVLPLAAFAEREGTFTNAERRVQRFRQARRSQGDLPAPWELMQQIARRVVERLEPGDRAEVLATNGRSGVQAVAVAATGASRRGGKTSAASPASAPAAIQRWDYVVASDVMDEISASVRGYAGTSYLSFDLTRSAAWGRQSNEPIYYDGTSYANSEGVGVQIPASADDPRASFALSLRGPATRAPDSDRPFMLLAPARAYDGGNWVRGSKLLPRQVPPHAILSRADAARLGVALGERVKIMSSSGALELPVTVDAGLAAGLVLVPAVRGAQLGAIVTGGQTAVAVQKVER